MKARHKRRRRQARLARRKRERAWLARMAQLEEERGPFLPNGFAGGVVARKRREASKEERRWA
jgi:hypothetical protein